MRTMQMGHRMRSLLAITGTLALLPPWSLPSAAQPGAPAGQGPEAVAQFAEYVAAQEAPGGGRRRRRPARRWNGCSRPRTT